jgi:RimJ/RimL family protein N-acetyltransferase
MVDISKTIDCAGTAVTIRRFRPEDQEAMMRFARALPEHDLLFVGRDLKHRKVVEAWLARIEDGHIDSLIAVTADGTIVATTAMIRDPLGWSPHVGEVRLLVAIEMRSHGLGRTMLRETFRIASHRDLRKLTARMTPDQVGAIALFQRLGFRAEALLKDHVMRRDGKVHDLAIFSQDVSRIAEQIGD